MEKPKTIDFQHINHNHADLTVIEKQQQLPFSVQRVYWLTNVPEDQIRGNSATKYGKRIVACIKGEVTIMLEDQEGNVFKFVLDNPNSGLYIPNLYWSEITFSADSILLCLVSNSFDEDDYIRDKENFQALSQANG